MQPHAMRYLLMFFAWHARGPVSRTPGLEASLTGVVTDSSGQPIADVQLRLAPLDAGANPTPQVRSDSAGHFGWRGLAPGRYELAAQRIGYEPVSVTINLADGVAQRVIIRLKSIVRLDSVVTRAKSLTPARYGPSSRMDDFYQSMHDGLGKFFTREKLDSIPAISAADVVSAVPGVRVGFATTSQGPKILVRMARCGGGRIDNGDGWGGVALVIDGVLIRSDRSSAFDQLKASDLEAMAVYRGFAEVPAELAGHACGAIYVWTRFGAASKDH